MSLRPSLLGFLMLGCSSAAELQPSAPFLTPQGYLAELSGPLPASISQPS